MQQRPGRLRAALLPLSLFLLVFGAKLVVIGRYGSDLPFWDQWAKEGELLYAPWFEHGEWWHNLFLAHNEHRIAPTLALNFSLVLAGGQWDARAQCVANAVLDSAVAAALFVWARRRLGAAGSAAAYTVITLLFGLPLAWDNVVGGFQSQYYFLVGFSLLAIHGLTAHRAFSARWCWGMAAGLAACVSMGSGLLFAVPAIGACALLAVRKARPDLRPRSTLAACAAVAALAWMLRPRAPWHETIHAQSAGEFLRYVVHCMAWPIPQWPWLALVLWAPWVVAAARLLRRARPDDDTLFAVAGGFWALLQLAAVAYSRGAGGGLPANRYGSIMIVGLVFNFISLALLIRGNPRKPWLAFGLLWLAAASATPVVSATAMLRHDLPERAQLYRAGEQNVREYVKTGDMKHLNGQQIPFPDAAWLARMLDRPSLRKLLPASVNDGSWSSPFSEGARWFADQGWVVMGFGAAMAVAAAALLSKREIRN